MRLRLLHSPSQMLVQWHIKECVFSRVLMFMCIWTRFVSSWRLPHIIVDKVTTKSFDFRFMDFSSCTALSSLFSLKIYLATGCLVHIYLLYRFLRFWHVKLFSFNPLCTPPLYFALFKAHGKFTWWWWWWEFRFENAWFVENQSVK